MGKSRLILAAFISVILLSCSTINKTPIEKSKANYPPFKIKMKEEEQQKREGAEELNIKIPVIEYESPEKEVSKKEEEETPSATVYNKVQKFTVLPKKETFSGGAVVYNYIDNRIYKLFLAPRKLTEISFEPGETIISPPACGDTINFILGVSHSAKNGKKVEQVFIKPVESGKKSTLVVNTDRRVYRFSLTSYENTFMPLVYFNYPMDNFQEIKQAEAVRKTNEITISGDIRDFDFSYKIIPHDIHMPAWAPSMVFTDGVKTYINFPSARRTAYAPVLFKVENRKDRALINYRVTGDYYIVDEVLEHAELVVDINAGNLITIKRVRK